MNDTDKQFWLIAYGAALVAIASRQSVCVAGHDDQLNPSFDTEARAIANSVVEEAKKLEAFK